jgi:hypothetical protein
VHAEAAHAEVGHRAPVHDHQRRLAPAARDRIGLAAPTADLAGLGERAQHVLDRLAAALEVGQRGVQDDRRIAHLEDPREVRKPPGQIVAHAAKGAPVDHEGAIGRGIPAPAVGDPVEEAHAMDFSEVSTASTSCSCLRQRAM